MLGKNKIIQNKSNSIKSDLAFIFYLQLDVRLKELIIYNMFEDILKSL